MRIRSFFAVLITLFMAAGLYAADIAPLQEDLFKSSLAAMQARPSGDYRDGLYPSDPAIFYLSGWMLTGNEACLKAAQTQLAVSHSWVDRNGLFDTSRSGQVDKITRGSVARHIFNYYIAYRVLGERRMLVHVDRCADAMMERFKRETFTYKGKPYLLFDVLYDARKPYKPASGTWIDAREDAEIGLTFALLYHDKDSKWYQNATVKDIALNELQASMALQTMQTGAIAISSLPEWADKYDTTSGCATLFAWAWASRLWQEELPTALELGIRIRRACDWLDPYFDGDTRSVNWQPKYSEGQLGAPQAWQALPGFYDQGRDLKRLWSVYERAITTADTTAWPTWLCGQAYLYVMDMPYDVLKASGLPLKWLPVQPAVPTPKAAVKPAAKEQPKPTAAPAAAPPATEEKPAQ